MNLTVNNYSPTFKALNPDMKAIRENFKPATVKEIESSLPTLKGLAEDVDINLTAPKKDTLEINISHTNKFQKALESDLLLGNMDGHNYMFEEKGITKDKLIAKVEKTKQTFLSHPIMDILKDIFSDNDK